jgi:predicted amidophosphoribosyltransferase
MARVLPSAVHVSSSPSPYCPSCHVIVAADPADRYCELCGTELTLSHERLVRCSCAPDRDLAGAYCPRCGTAVAVLVQRYAEAQP